MGILLLLAALPTGGAALDRVDLIDVNHVRPNGRTTHVQALFYDWDGLAYRLRDWRLLTRQERPERDWVRGDWVLWLRDAEGLREIRAAAVRTTYTQHDTELLERRNLPKTHRRPLTTPVKDYP